MVGKNVKTSERRNVKTSECRHVATSKQLSVATVETALATVTDPEIPVINILEMGIVAGVRIAEGRVVVALTPTFAACPAVDVIREETRRAVSSVFSGPIEVKIVYDPPWTSDRITEEGRRKLKAFGLAPPHAACGNDAATAGATRPLGQVPCPYCDSTNTELESLFGPTLCRSIHYCRACLQSFEQFKDV